MKIQTGQTRLKSVGFSFQKVNIRACHSAYRKHVSTTASTRKYCYIKNSFRPKKICLRTSTIKPLAYRVARTIITFISQEHNTFKNICIERRDCLSVQFFYLSHLLHQRSQNNWKNTISCALTRIKRWNKWRSVSTAEFVVERTYFLGISIRGYGPEKIPKLKKT